MLLIVLSIIYDAVTLLCILAVVTRLVVLPVCCYSPGCASCLLLLAWFCFLSVVTRLVMLPVCCYSHCCASCVLFLTLLCFKSAVTHRAAACT